MNSLRKFGSMIHIPNSTQSKTPRHIKGRSPLGSVNSFRIKAITNAISAASRNSPGDSDSRNSSGRSHRRGFGCAWLSSRLLHCEQTSAERGLMCCLGQRRTLKLDPQKLQKVGLPGVVRWQFRHNFIKASQRRLVPDLHSGEAKRKTRSHYG